MWKQQMSVGGSKCQSGGGASTPAAFSFALLMRSGAASVAASATVSLLFGVGIPAQAQSVLAEYDFQEGSPTVPGKDTLQSNDIDTNSLVSNLAISPGVGGGVSGVGDIGLDVGNASANRFPGAIGVADVFITGSTLAEASAGQDYLSFTLSPTAGTTLRLTSFSFTAAISALATNPTPNLINRISVLSSATGFTAANSLLDATVTTVYNQFNTRTFFQSFSVSLGSAPFQSLTVPTEFRFYFFNPNGTRNGDSLLTGNIVVRGAVTPPSTAAPEPGSLTLLLPVVGGVGMVIRKRKRSQK